MAEEKKEQSVLRSIDYWTILIYVALLAFGANYRGACWRVVDPATGMPGAPAFAIRRGTGELIGRGGGLSLMPNE